MEVKIGAKYKTFTKGYIMMKNTSNQKPIPKG